MNLIKDMPFSERGPNPPIYLDPDKIFDFYKNYDKQMPIQKT